MGTDALTEEQQTHFLEHGWVHLPGAIPEKNIRRYTQDVWIRTGYDPLDSGTWAEEKFRMPRHKEMLWKEFAPKGYGAICDILGGEDRLDPTIFNKAGDSLIANFGKEEYRDVMCTGKAGDMFICHGFMLHSASKNHLRIPRFITSPKFVLKDPFNYNRENLKDYSLLELKTLKELGVSYLPDWKFIGQRARFNPDNNVKKDSRLPFELERLKAHASKTGGIIDSIHVISIAEYNGWTEDRIAQGEVIPV
ncbi:hypothetical protein M422DRAFT_254845 [Sphaerobolus stellatus SS14]|uniref:Phytanoyl-CoA dioxygenase n=1 Tax=Sphaerobolus stellatus (strain SS14) TaxID=990650 RepID=A0A0C9VV38_SPHS4|nr:hypothetical protein M422DRAFT_254845 [Sphaerobolus stellatus SS14]